MYEALSPQEFSEKYEEYMLNGLGSYSTYIPLKTNKRVGINIGIRPYVLRVSDGVTMFGGKLRVGYTIGDNGEYVKSKIVAINSDQRVEALKDFCKGFSWQKQDERRFSTIVGIGIAAGPYDGEVLEKIVEDGLAMELLNRLESTYSQYNDGATFNAKRKAATALMDAWLIQAGNVFAPMPETQKLPEEVLGEKTKLLNKAQDSYHDNVVSFAEKVEELKNAE